MAAQALLQQLPSAGLVPAALHLQALLLHLTMLWHVRPRLLLLLLGPQPLPLPRRRLLRALLRPRSRDLLLARPVLQRLAPAV